MERQIATSDILHIRISSKLRNHRLVGYIESQYIADLINLAQKNPAGEILLKIGQVDRAIEGLFEQQTHSGFDEEYNLNELGVFLGDLIESFQSERLLLD